MNNIFRNSFRKLKDWWFKGKYTTNEKAADIIKRFVDGSCGPYEWDDFESQKENNPEADIALELCWFFANKYPGNESTEYCGEEAIPFFLKIADILEHDGFSSMEHEKIKESLRNGLLPSRIEDMLKSN